MHATRRIDPPILLRLTRRLRRLRAGARMSHAESDADHHGDDGKSHAPMLGGMMGLRKKETFVSYDRLVMREMIALGLIAFLVGAGSVRGAEPSLGESAHVIHRASGERDGDRVVVGYISRTLRMSVATLREQRKTTGLGWGELLIANYIAQTSRAPFPEVVGDFQGGKSWEDIARDRKVDVKALTANVKQAIAAISQRSDDKPPPVGTVIPGYGIVPTEKRSGTSR